MATLAGQTYAPAPEVGDERFFLRGAIVMTVVIVSGFAFQYLMGRSTFSSPLRVHLHAWFFMGWVGIYLLQNVFVATGRLHLHRRLGWIAVGWLVPMIVMGFIEPFTKELPMEYAVEMNRLIKFEMEGSIG